MKQHKLRVSVKAVAKDHLGRVLIVNFSDEGNNNWSYPGGGIEDGESFVDALQREVSEETGFSLSKIGKIIYVLDITLENGAHQIELFFDCKLSDEKPGTAEAKYKLANKDEFKKYLTLPQEIDPFSKGIMAIDFAKVDLSQKT